MSTKCVRECYSARPTSRINDGRVTRYVYVRHVFVRHGCVLQASFGQSYPYGFEPQNPAPWYHAGWIKTYEQAIQPLADAGVLVVAAAGNENMDMDALLANGYAYSPCLIQVRWLSVLLCCLDLISYVAL